MEDQTAHNLFAENRLSGVEATYDDLVKFSTRDRNSYRLFVRLASPKLSLQKGTQTP